MLSGWPFFFYFHLGGVAVTCRQAKLCWRVNRGKVAVGVFFFFSIEFEIIFEKKKNRFKGFDIRQFLISRK